MFFISSFDVAKEYDKRHNNLMKRIESVGRRNPEFFESNFYLGTTKSAKGKDVNQYLMTIDGYFFLVMGFTGKKAAKRKIDSINRFNQMERELKGYE